MAKFLLSTCFPDDTGSDVNDHIQSKIDQRQALILPLTHRHRCYLGGSCDFDQRFFKRWGNPPWFRLKKPPDSGPDHHLMKNLF